MHTEKPLRKKKESASEDKENQEPNVIISNKPQMGNKNLNSLKIQIESRNGINGNNFLNSEKNLNLNSRENNLNLNIRGLEKGFEDNSFKPDNSLKNLKEKKKSFLSNNHNNDLNLIANSLQVSMNPSANAPNENIFLLRGAEQSNKFPSNNFDNNFNLVNPKEFLEASAKVNCNLKAGNSKISEFIFLKKKLTRDDVAKIKNEFLDSEQKLKVKKQSKKNKKLIENKKDSSHENSNSQIDLASFDIGKHENEIRDNLQIQEPNAFEENFNDNNDLNLSNRSKPLKNFFDIFLSQDDPFIQAAKLNQINNINSNLFRINQRSRLNSTNSNKRPSNQSASNTNIDNKNNPILEQSSTENNNFQVENNCNDYENRNNHHNSTLQQSGDQKQILNLEQHPMSIRKNFIENSYQVLQKGFDYCDDFDYKIDSNNSKLGKNKGKYVFNLISNPPCIVKSISKSKSKNKSKILKNFSACENEILPIAAGSESNKENVYPDKSKNETNYSSFVEPFKALKYDSIPEEEKMQISDSSNNNYNRHKYWVKTRSHSSKGSSRKCKLFGGLRNPELNAELEQIKKKLVFPFKGKSRSKGDISDNNSDFKENDILEKPKCLENNCPNEVKNKMLFGFKDIEDYISNENKGNTFIRNDKNFRQVLFSLSSTLPLVVSQESLMHFGNQNEQSFNCPKVLGERGILENKKKQQAEIAILNPFRCRSKMPPNSEIAQKSKQDCAYKHLLEKLNISNSLKSQIECTNKYNMKPDKNSFYPSQLTDTLKNSNVLSSYFQNARYSAIQKYLERRKSINLKITKSNVSLNSINTSFIVTKDGLTSSQRSKGNDHISIGRQQINDDGVRPNDIMLFPTDPSISRSHFKIFYKGFFTDETVFFEKLQILLNLLYVDKRPKRPNTSEDPNGKAGKLLFNCDDVCDFNLINKNEKLNFGKAIEDFNLLGYGLHSDFDCKKALFNKYNEKLNAENMGLEFDFDSFLVRPDADKDEFVTEFEDKKKSESLFIKNFFAVEDNDNANNEEESGFENGIPKDKNKANYKPLLHDKGCEELFNTRHIILPLIKSFDHPDDAVSSFVEIPNADNNFNNKTENFEIQIESTQTAKQNANYINNNRSNKININEFEIPFNKFKNHITHTNDPKNPNNKAKFANYPDYLKKLTPLVIQDILKYFIPKEEVFIEDNSTIYGTYVRIKPYSVVNLISNIYFIYSCLNVYDSVNNFSFENALHVLLNNEKDFKKIGAELFRDFTTESALKDKDTNKKLTANALNPQSRDFAIKSAGESEAIVIKECNVNNYIFYNVENANLLETVRRKYSFEKNEAKNFSQKNKSNKTNNIFMNNCNRVSFRLNNSEDYNNNSSIGNRFPSNFLREEKSNLQGEYVNRCNFNINHDLNKISSRLNNHNSENNSYFGYFGGNYQRDLDINPFKNTKRLISEHEENHYSRQNTEFGLDYLKEKFKNLTLKEPKAQVYAYDLNFGKSLENAMLNNLSSNGDRRIEADDIKYNNCFNEFAAQENCLVSAYTHNNYKKSERVNNKSLENELFMLFLNKKKIDFLLKNFANEAFNPYKPDSPMLLQLNSANPRAIVFNALHGNSGVICNDGFNSNNYSSLMASNKKAQFHYPSNNFKGNNHNSNSNTNQKQQQQYSNNSNTSSQINFNNNNLNFNQITFENSANIANRATNNINNLLNQDYPFKTRSYSSNRKPAFDSSNYPSSKFLNFLFENLRNQYSNQSKSLNYLTRFYCKNLAFLESHMAASQNSYQTSSLSSLSKLFTESNFILKSESVFLNSAKSGFIVSKIGCFEEIIKTIKHENQEFFNAETQSGKIEFISFDKFFEFQKLDLNSREFKGEIDKSLLLSSQGIFQKSFFNKEKEFEKHKKDFSFLYLIETFGDPCGIMNRQREIVFMASKVKKIENLKLFAFNNRPGFLLGSEINCSVFHRDWEAQAFLAYEPILDHWIVSDLTCFLKPGVFYSNDYHGLWLCVSPDKRSVNRFSPVKYAVRSGDEIKVSETVMKVDFEYRC